MLEKYVSIITLWAILSRELRMIIHLKILKVHLLEKPNLSLVYNTKKTYSLESLGLCTVLDYEHVLNKSLLKEWKGGLEAYR